MVEWKDVGMIMVIVMGMIIVAYIIARPKSTFFTRDPAGNVTEIHERWT